MDYGKSLLVLHISYECNEKCIFCSEAFRLRTFWGKFLDKEKIFFLLKKWYKKGIRQVHFTGGEPLLHPDILDILRFSKNIGYKVNILTNGLLLADEKFFLKAMKYLDLVDLSVHCKDKESCTYLTNNIDNYDKLLNLFKLIKKYKVGKNFFIDTVILKSNLKDILEIYRFVLKYFVPNFYLFSYLAPEGDGMNIFKKEFVSFKKINTELSKIFSINDGVRKIIAGVPLCELNDNLKNFSNDVHFSSRITIEVDKNENGVFYLREVLTKKPIRNRKYLKKCETCKFKRICGGYPILYNIS